MGFRIEAPKQDGNARFNSLKVNLNENNSATRTVVADEQGNFYYGAGGTGGASGTSGSSGTSGANGAPGANGTSGESGTSGTSGTGFNTIADPLQGRVLLSDGSTNNASASLNLFYDTGSSIFQITGSVNITGSLTGSTDLLIRSTTSEPIRIGRAYYSASNGNNLVFGHGTLRSGSTGANRNIAIGDYALATLNSGIENVALGYGALYYATNNRNTAVGAYALFYTTGSTGFRNNAFGAYALAFNTTGEVNSAFGSYSLYANVIGNYNAGMGDFSLRFLSTGSSNAALGQAAGFSLRSGEGNVFVGRGAAPSLLSGSNNTILGAITPNADINTPIFGLITGSYNTIIGSNVKYLSSTLNNNIILADGEGNIKYRWDTVQNNLYGNTTVSGSLTATSSVLFPSLTEAPQNNVVLIDTTTGQLYYTGSTSFNVVSSSYPIAVSGSTLYSVNPNAGTNFNANQNIFLGEGSGQDSQYTTFAVSLGYEAGYQSNFSQSYSDNGGDFTASVIFIGYQAGYQQSQSRYSTFIGNQAGYQTEFSNGTNFIGDSAGYLAKNGNNSNFIGRDAGASSDGIRYSNVIGVGAGWGSLDIIDSNFIGESVGENSEKILNSNFIGIGAGLQTNSCTGSNFIGYYTGQDITSSYSTLIGWKAGANPSRVDSIGSNNIIIGTGITLEKDRKDSINIGGIIFGTGSYFPTDVFFTPMNSGSANGKIGINQPNPQYTLDVSGSLNTVLDARINGLNVGRGGGNLVSNLSIGQSALLNNTTGQLQVALGTLALYSASAGSNNNIAIGYATQYNTTSGYSNVVVGKQGLFYNTIGAVNTAVGNNVMLENVSGYGNNAFGDGALRTNTIGSENAAFGTHAGRYITGGASPNRSGSNSIFLGSYTKALADGQTNQIVIGYGSVGLGSNTTVLGNSSTTDTWLGGKVLIGTNQTSSYQLRVVGSTDISGSLTTTGSILFPSLTQSPQSNAVLIDTTTGQLYYTASSAIVVTSSISASYAPNIYNSNGILTSDRTVNLSTYTLNFSKSITTNGVTVGTGPANSSTNSVLGFQALNFNTSSIGTVAIGYQAALVASGSSRSVYIGYRTLYEAFAGKTGFQNVYVGGEAGRGANTNYAVFLGAVAGYFTSGSYSIHIGHYAGWQTNGSYNVILGANTAGGLGSGDYNTIIGSQVSGLSNISNNIILSDGQGNIRARHDAINWDISGSLLPSVTELFDLGSSTRKWKDLYLSGSTIYLGNIQLKEIEGNFVVSSLSGNPAFSGSFSGSLFGSSSWATNSLTASSADDFTVRGTLTAQTIVAQVITSSVQYITGSTQFGSLLSNTHQFTGSVFTTGSFIVSGSGRFTGDGSNNAVYISSGKRINFDNREVSIGDQSTGSYEGVAIGWNAKANTGTVVLGKNCSSSTYNRVFMVGWNNAEVLASSHNTVAIYGTNTSGIGIFGTTSNLINSTEIAILGTAIGAGIEGNVAIGRSAYASGSYAVALGPFAEAFLGEFVVGSRGKPVTNVYFGSGHRSTLTITGPGASYTINGSSGLGTDENAGNITIAGGKGTGAGTSGDIILSTATPTTSGTTLQSLTQRVWVKGNTGYVGIDNTLPSTILTVGNTSADNGGITVLANNTSDTYDVFSGQRKYPRITLIDSISGGSTFQIWNLGNQLRFGTNGGSISTSAFNVNAGDAASVIFNGDVGIKQPSPSYALDVTGTIRATGDVIAYSDARVKDNVETIENALEKVISLRGVSYTRKDTEDKSRKLGVIAQELLPIIPEAVSKDLHGNYSVSYGNMVGLLIEAIKEQQKQIDELKLLLKK